MADVSADSDPRQNYFTGSVSFGPNRVDSMIDETSVSGYKVLLVDSAGATLSTVSTVAKSNVATSDCDCNANAYTVQMTAVELHASVAGVMIVAIDSNNVDMPVGHVKALVDDYETTTTTAPPQARGSASGARPSRDASLVGVSAALAALAVLAF